MAKIKSAMVLVIVMIMLAAVCVPMNTEAATKKTITVTASNVKIKNNKMTLGKQTSKQLVVKYAGKKVTSKATYKSSNKKVATITKKGKITTKKNGTTTITIKYKGKTKKLKTTVHTHTWKAHYKTTQVPYLVRQCTKCGWEKEECTDPTCNCEYNHEPGTWSEHDYNEHVMKNEFAGYTIITKYKTERKIDYYTCSCGAKKTVK